MLIPIPLPLIGGSATTPYVNAGSVQNTGFELEFNYKNNQRKFKYNFVGNFATLYNKVLSLDNGAPIPGGRIDNGIYATLTDSGSSDRVILSVSDGRNFSKRCRYIQACVPG